MPAALSSCKIWTSVKYCCLAAAILDLETRVNKFESPVSSGSFYSFYSKKELTPS